MTQDSKVSRLQDITFRRICLDIGRHSLKYAKDKDNVAYLILLRDHSDEFLETITNISEHSSEPPLQEWPSSIYRCVFLGYEERNPRECFDFIFNRFQHRLQLTQNSFNEDVSLAISRNCKDLLKFSLCNVSLSPKISVPLIHSIRKLTHLSLNYCKELGLEGMEAISTSLRSLKTLDLFESTIPQNGIYVLCGHKPRFQDSDDLACCFTKNCEHESPLKLHRINMTGCRLKECEIACILTHIPTLHIIDPQFSFILYNERFGVQLSTFCLARTICKIAESRVLCGMSEMTFEIEKLKTGLVISSNFALLFRQCPKLKYLQVGIVDTRHFARRILPEVLARSALQSLEAFEVIFRETKDITTGQFMAFWETKGLRLKELRLKQVIQQSLNFSSRDFNGVITLCPRLESLTVMAIFSEGSEIIQCFSSIPNLRSLTMHLYGDANKAYKFAYKLLLSSNNISGLVLNGPRRLPTDNEFFLKITNILTNEAVYPYLKDIELNNETVHFN